jgi:hypothetical protein
MGATGIMGDGPTYAITDNKKNIFLFIKCMKTIPRDSYFNVSIIGGIMEDLLLKKREVIERNLPELMKQVRGANQEILKLMEGPLKDEKTSFKIQFDIFQKLNLGGEYGKDSSTKMDGQQQLELAKLYFDNAKMIVGTLDKSAKKHYSSYMKTIDEQMKLYQNQLKYIDDELKKVEDEDKRRTLEQKRNELYKRSS